MFSAFLMDLDGTIFDSRRSFIVSYNQALAKNRLPALPEDELKAMAILRQRVEDILPAILGEDMSRDEQFTASFIKDLREAYGGIFVSLTRLSPMAKETVGDLRRLGMRIGIVSSRLSFADFIRPLIDEHGIGAMIDLIVTSRDVARTKPSPEPFFLAARRLNLEAQKCVAVGDSPDDIIAGKAAGMLTVAYTGGFFTQEELSRQQPDLTIDDLHQLVDLVHGVK
jgi:phosphoglycolate phosphatase-like HAD superfamily hydrolase